MSDAESTPKPAKPNVFCLKCSTQFPAAFLRCPKCRRTNYSHSIWGIATIVIIVLAIAFLVWLVPPSEQPPDGIKAGQSPGTTKENQPQVTTQERAIAACEERIRHQIANGHFKVQAAPFIPPNNGVQLDGRDWIISGPVDMENEAGGVIQAAYACEIAPDGSGPGYLQLWRSP